MALDPITVSVAKPLIKPAIQLASSGALHGLKFLSRWFSPTILIAGQNSSGKTSLRNFFVRGHLPSNILQNDETHIFESKLVNMSFDSGHASRREFSFWIRDSRGFFDAGPIVRDVNQVKPVFIIFVFDIRRIEDEAQLYDDETIAAQTMRYADTQRWVRQFVSRVQEYIATESKAKKRLCGAAVLINKCDTVDLETYERKLISFRDNVRPIFRDLQPLLSFGERSFDVFKTTLIKDRDLPNGQLSQLPEFLSFMIGQMIDCGEIK